MQPLQVLAEDASRDAAAAIRRSSVDRFELERAGLALEAELAEPLEVGTRRLDPLGVEEVLQQVGLDEGARHSLGALDPAAGCAGGLARDLADQESGDAEFLALEVLVEDGGEQDPQLDLIEREDLAVGDTVGAALLGLDDRLDQEVAVRLARTPDLEIALLSHVAPSPSWRARRARRDRSSRWG